MKNGITNLQGNTDENLNKLSPHSAQMPPIRDQKPKQNPEDSEKGDLLD
jgi:hypothetical protein